MFYCRSLLSFIFYGDDLIKWLPCNIVRLPNVKVEKNIVYDESVPKYGMLDVYYDETKKGKYTEGKYPVFFNIHGGGWISGDKSFRVGFCKHMADTGCAVVNINYGLAPRYKFDDMMRQIFAALKWMEANAEKYCFDLDKMIISGDSAGGQLSMATINALEIESHREKLRLPEFPHRFKAFVSNCSAYNFDSFLFRVPFLREMAMLPTGKVLLHKMDERYEYYEQLMTVQHINENFPKCFVVTGLQDIFTMQGNRQFLKKLAEKNIEFERFHSVEPLNSFHDFNLKIYMPSARVCLNRTKAYVTKIISE